MKKLKRPINIFISYSHCDVEMKDILLNHLSYLQKDGMIKCWTDNDIPPGAVWNECIIEHLNKSEIVIALVSADALASEYIYSTEMKLALEYAHEKRIILIPIILNACIWNRTDLSKYQKLPKANKTISDWDNLDVAFTDVVGDLYNLFNQKLKDSEEDTHEASKKTKSKSEKSKKSKSNKGGINFNGKTIVGTVIGQVDSLIINDTNNVE